jgi:hypothetical protein
MPSQQGKAARRPDHRPELSRAQLNSRHRNGHWRESSQRIIMQLGKEGLADGLTETVAKRWNARAPEPAACRASSRGRDRIMLRVWRCGSIGPMTELTDVSGAFGYGDSILAGKRVRLRGVRDDDLPALAKWEMDPGRLATLSS